MRIIAGELKGRRLKTTWGPGYRPATGRVREALFAMLEALGLNWPEVRVLDVFAGSGALGLEALSRGAGLSWFVEKKQQACSLIRQNISELGISPSRTRVIRQDALFWLKKEHEETFGLVFMDPPYGRNMLAPALQGLGESGLLQDFGLVCAEIEGRLEFDAGRQQGMQLIKDRNYGQTRIIVWEKK
ncbi:MAG: 16S rRNA (guanine(966)-N(2))-methyltransferase RsmD [Desulfonatronovibrionaceae bacterium]